MASRRENYSADYFKKDTKLSETGDEVMTTASDSSEDEDAEVTFNPEDLVISRLYRKAVDSIMTKNKLREMNVNLAINKMKQEISVGHKKGFRNFRDINLSEPTQCCAYLRRYAICHTGLVKRVMWNFFECKFLSDTAKEVREEITGRNHLKVISLGGGPGNDFVGFCSALQEFPNADVSELDLYTVDISKSWMSVFRVILQNARTAEFGSFSECVKKIKISVGFKVADLTEDGIFEDEDLSATLEQVHVVLMVKLTSFLPNEETGNLIENVANSMKPGTILIFIDHPYDKEFFKQVKSLQLIYHSYTKYELSFNPTKYHSPSIPSTQASIGIYKSIKCLSESSSDSEES